MIDAHARDLAELDWLRRVQASVVLGLTARLPEAQRALVRAQIRRRERRGLSNALQASALRILSARSRGTVRSRTQHRLYQPCVRVIAAALPPIERAVPATCRQGHPLTASRTCRTCHRLRVQRWRAKRDSKYKEARCAA